MSRENRKWAMFLREVRYLQQMDSLPVPQTESPFVQAIEDAVAGED